MSVRSVQNMTLQGGGVERSLSPSSDLVGDFEAIATITVGSGGAASIEFTSIPSTYQHLQVRCVVRGDTADTVTELRWRAGNGSVDTGSNYSNHLLYGTGAAAYATGYSSQAYAWLGSPTAANATSSVFGAFVIDLLDYASTSKNKTIRALGGRDVNGSGVAFIASAAWLSASAVDVLRIYPGVGNWAQHTTAALYGVRA